MPDADDRIALLVSLQLLPRLLMLLLPMLLLLLLLLLLAFLLLLLLLLILAKLFLPGTSRLAIAPTNMAPAMANISGTTDCGE